MLIQDIRNDKVRSIISSSPTPASDILALRGDSNEYIFNDDAWHEANAYFGYAGGIVAAARVELARMSALEG